MIEIGDVDVVVDHDHVFGRIGGGAALGGDEARLGGVAGIFQPAPTASRTRGPLPDSGVFMSVLWKSSTAPRPAIRCWPLCQEFSDVPTTLTRLPRESWGFRARLRECRNRHVESSN